MFSCSSASANHPHPSSCQHVPVISRPPSFHPSLHLSLSLCVIHALHEIFSFKSLTSIYGHLGCSPAECSPSAKPQCSSKFEQVTCKVFSTARMSHIAETVFLFVHLSVGISFFPCQMNIHQSAAAQHVAPRWDLEEIISISKHPPCYYFHPSDPGVKPNPGPGAMLDRRPSQTDWFCLDIKGNVLEAKSSWTCSWWICVQKCWEMWFRWKWSSCVRVWIKSGNIQPENVLEFTQVLNSKM